MAKDENWNKFSQHLIETLELDSNGELTPTTSLLELEEWDSLAQLSFIVMADEEYQKRLDGDNLAACAIIGDLYDLVK